MQKVTNKLRVLHFAQVPCKPFIVEVADEYEAYKIANVLADQHLFLYEQNIIPDYANMILVEMYEDLDGKGNPGWTEYYNEAENMEWDELEETYFKQR